AEAVNGTDPRFLQMLDRLFEQGAPLAARGRLLALVLQSRAQPELELASCLLGECQRRDRLHGAAALGQHVDEPGTELAGLARSGGGLDHERLVERRPDALALGLIDHGDSLSARRSASRAGSLTVTRVSSSGPHTSRKSHIEHARGRGAGGKKPVAMARSIVARTSTPRRRVSAESGTTRSENPPARVQ